MGMSFTFRDLSKLSALSGTNLVLFCVGAVCITALIVAGKLDSQRAYLALGGLAAWLAPSPVIATAPPAGDPNAPK